MGYLGYNPLYSGVVPLWFLAHPCRMGRLVETRMTCETHVLLQQLIKPIAGSKTQGFHLKGLREYVPTWRIIPFSKWLVTPIYKP